ncbi:hypothetical protein [Hyalangium gracile]|uniref:hypothetical protein n=1 Tax=Hyalangium gracile TaxID=394092 RepID=UPI001CCF6F20|nr:hypothetical protein [Hyalangium gracile]
MRPYLVLGLLWLGCASAPGGSKSALVEPDEVPEKENVYLVPLDEAMLVTRQLLEARKYDVFEREEGRVLLTSTVEPGTNPADFRAWERYYVKGESLGPRQSVVRIFRLRYNQQENVIESPPKMIGAREEEECKAAQKRAFDRDLGAGAADLETFRMARGKRDLELERQLLARLEMVPALELVGGNAAVPIRSVVVDGWGETPGEPVPSSECGAPLPGAEPLLMPAQTVLLADPLGTRELPVVAARLLCDAASKGFPVALGLSLPASEQALLNEYLASEGNSRDVGRFLVRSSFWRRVYQDGRSSRSVLWLLEQVRRLRASGRAVELVAFDSEEASGDAREAEMARHLLEYRKAHPQSWLLALAGGVHVRTAGVEWDEAYAPLGVRLARELPSVRALAVGFERGTQFTCRYNVWEKVTCDLFAISPTQEARQLAGGAQGVQLFSSASPEGFHGRLYVGALSASPPALLRLARASAEQPAAEPKSASSEAKEAAK